MPFAREFFQLLDSLIIEPQQEISYEGGPFKNDLISLPELGQMVCDTVRVPEGTLFLDTLKFTAETWRGLRP